MRSACKIGSNNENCQVSIHYALSPKQHMSVSLTCYKSVQTREESQAISYILMLKWQWPSQVMLQDRRICRLPIEMAADVPTI